MRINRMRNGSPMLSEFKYYSGNEVHKIYLSAILDLYDRRIVTFKISDHNDNPLVMNTFDEAVCLEPDAHPFFLTLFM